MVVAVTWAAIGVIVVTAGRSLPGESVEASPDAVLSEARSTPMAPDPATDISLSIAQQWHDEARAITPTAVWFDESVRETWLLRYPRLLEAANDPRTATETRNEIEAAIVHMERLGALRK